MEGSKRGGTGINGRACRESECGGWGSEAVVNPKTVVSNKDLVCMKTCRAVQEVKREVVMSGPI